MGMGARAHERDSDGLLASPPPSPAQPPSFLRCFAWSDARWCTASVRLSEPLRSGGRDVFVAAVQAELALSRHRAPALDARAADRLRTAAGGAERDPISALQARGRRGLKWCA